MGQGVQPTVLSGGFPGKEVGHCEGPRGGAVLMWAGGCQCLGGGEGAFWPASSCICYWWCVVRTLPEHTVFQLESSFPVLCMLFEDEAAP